MVGLQGCPDDQANTWPIKISKFSVLGAMELVIFAPNDIALSKEED